MLNEQSEHGTIREYRPPVASGALTSDRGTRFQYSVGQGTDMGSGMNNRTGSVRTLPRARAAVRSASQRLADKRDMYTGLERK